MSSENQTMLSRRERQIMDVLYRLGAASGADVRGALPDAPSYSAVRALLRILEAKGHVRHEEEGGRYIYRPMQPRRRAARNALAQVVQTFFGGSVTDTVAALVSNSESRLSDEDLARLSELIEQARREGR